MSIEDVVKDIVEKEDIAISKAFTLCIGKLLRDKDLTPVMVKEILTDEDISEKYQRILLHKEGIRFIEIDTTEHDKQIRSDAIDEFAKLIHQDLYQLNHHQVDFLAEKLKEQKG